MSTQPVPPPKTIHVRTYAPRDRDAVVELFTAGMLLYSATPGEIEPMFAPYLEESINGDLATIDATYMASGGHFWVATCTEESGEEVVVGMVGLEGKPDGAFELRRMSVRTEYRRYGVGKKLVTHLEQWARDQGVQKVWLSTGGPMVQAHRFYESMGYTNYKKETMPEGFEIVFYEKRIA